MQIFRYKINGLVILAMLTLQLVAGLQTTQAQAQAHDAPITWQEVKLQKECTFEKLSSYQPNKAWCQAKNEKVPGDYIPGLADLSTGEIEFISYISSNLLSLLYEDAATGYILVLTADGRITRIEPEGNYQKNHQVVITGPTSHLTSSMVRVGGYGSGTLCLRHADYSVWECSYDAGKTWKNPFPNTDPFDKKLINDMYFVPGNPQIVYGISQTVVEAIPSGGSQYYSLVYKSTDSARTFKQVYKTPYFSNEAASVPFSYNLVVPESVAVGANVVYLTNYYYQPNYNTYVHYRSTDGGTTFSEFGRYSGRSNQGGQPFYASDGAVLKTGVLSCAGDGSCTITSPAMRSVDYGATFSPLNLSNLPGYYMERFFLPSQANGVYYALAKQPGRSQFDPNKRLPAKLMRSVDYGQTWTVVTTPEQFGENVLENLYLRLTDYSPLTLLATNEGKWYILKDPISDQNQTRAAGAYPGQDFYKETGHNLGLFKDYWTKNGGLAQFGYPRTEVFREVNPSDGRIYPVQYFERNRFEYHPELKGTKYEVLLGLLGNQLTEERRAKGEGAFNRFDNQNYPGGLYFAETGHNLRNSFKAYWEANGGLAIYGYPISEEFEEVNPDDGKSYVVQYFERNRFEYHPELKGTKYEVLLGLLGNSLLRQKGWLPQA